MRLERVEERQRFNDLSEDNRSQIEAYSSPPHHLPFLYLFLCLLCSLLISTAEDDCCTKTPVSLSLSARFLKLHEGTRESRAAEREQCSNKMGGGGVESLWLGVDCVVGGLLINLK